MVKYVLHIQLIELMKQKKFVNYQMEIGLEKEHYTREFIPSMKLIILIIIQVENDF
ncbi:unnamed protein product [Schistosoma margrebowiei]|uniref:Uncharacterized protein n=1 Tax=Schistosoma margrebowiei TaxID=48269 RepID=A0A3P7Z4D0_9TREM|nr:unnamed protein product [Schistosoma margrebowiei]